MNTERPMPPSEIANLTAPDSFAPALELAEWLRSAYLDEDGPLYWEGHAHLRNAVIACLWTNVPFRKQGRPVSATAEQPGRVGGMARWKAARLRQQQQEWFGFEPDFLLTFDAIQCAAMDDMTFCALVDHELSHCGQAEDEYGMPKFARDTGKPVFTIKGHDVEEFVSVVQRFGIEAAGTSAVDLVIAAGQRPTIGKAKVAASCGTCLKLVA